jgi:O-methyltransferase/aklanonic acid methyltransferase
MFRRRKDSAPPLAGPDGSDWRSYDSVADVYARVRVPVHEEPARDLIGVLAPEPGTRLLDVGTGPGVAAVPALDAVGDSGLVIGVDLSPEMARLARAAGVHVAVAAAIDLPFRDGTFDAVASAFVLHLVPKYETTLFDMVRVLRPGGRLGLATWVAGHDEFTTTWREVAESFATKEMLTDALRRAAPWADQFSDPARIREILRDTGVRDVRTERRAYRTSSSIEDYLAGRETTVIGRFLRQMLGETLWERFRQRVDEAFRERFRDPIGDSNDVLLTVGTRDR